jgi:hypothetical protein
MGGGVIRRNVGNFPNRLSLLLVVKLLLVIKS